jgi:hypothetical protein
MVVGTREELLCFMETFRSLSLVVKRGGLGALWARQMNFKDFFSFQIGSKYPTFRCPVKIDTRYKADVWRPQI